MTEQGEPAGVSLRSRPPVLAAMPTRGSSGPSRLILALVLLVLAGLTLLHVFAPSTVDFYPRCGLFAWTGVHCPGCGSLRALHHLTHGRWLEALDANALLVLGLILGIVWALARWWRGRGFGWERALERPAMVWVLAGGCLVFGLLRNLPWYPFSLLAP